MKKIISLVALLFVFTSTITFAAELSAESQQALQQKKSFILDGLKLSDEEKIDFLPVYDAFQKEKFDLNNRKIAVIKDFSKSYNALTNVKAGELLDNWFIVEQAILDLKQSYIVKFEKVMKRKDVMRYYQIENKLEVLVDYELIKAVPLAK